ncbi:MAG: tripartite tricarboxylate transporter substrate binding protein [Burkholderiales bacterium]|nr:tripartite tricarboxylate transporter substrate binding protein [Burkholderiales bacterium]
MIRNRTRARRMMLAALAALLAAASTAHAQGYPVKTVRMVVGFPPGGGTDIFARSLSEKLTAAFDRPVIVDNRPGATSVIGTDIVAKSPPDGYTLLTASSAYAISAAVQQKKLPYDPLTALVPVSFIAVTPNVVLVHPSVPARNVKELIALARAKPGQLNYGSTGNGGPYHIATEMFKNMTKIDMVHVPYKGASPALTGAISGEVGVLFGNIVSATPHARAGRLRALAVTTTKRSPIAKDLPTVAESGVPGYDFATWFGVLAPAGTPSAVIARVNEEIRKALSAEDLRRKWLSEGAEPEWSTPEAFGKLIRNDIQRFTKLVRDVNITVD